MRTNRGLLSLFLLVLCLPETIEAREPSVEPILIKPTSRGRTPRREPDPTIVRQQKITVDLRVLRGSENQRFRLPVFDGIVLPLVRDRQEAPRENTLIWFGHVDGQPGSSVILSNVGEALAGDVTTMDRGKFRFFRIRSLGRGIHLLSELDPSKSPREGLPSAPVPSHGAAGDACSDPAAIIDVLTVYTGSARAAANYNDPTNPAGIEAEIYEAVAAANQAYANSQVAQRIRLVHMKEVNQGELGTIAVRDRLQNTSDGYLDDVLALRDSYFADIVVLIVRSLDACGWTYVMEKMEHAFEASAYAVVRRNCAGPPDYSFAHELGHIMGARHEWNADGADGLPFPYNHGFLKKSPSAGAGVPPWSTVMAIDLGCLADPPVNCTARVPHFSNPAVTYPINPSGDATGAPLENNAMALNETDSTVANFRCVSPGVNNVWMKDSPNDTGAEPDPQTAVDDMWKSPAVWVRNTQDVGGLHPHDHENPIAGRNNWVYVELQNGGGNINGNLELYWANASTSLVWPTGWNLISSTPVAFTSPSTRIAETTWTPAQAGHFCLLARWSSVADPMTHAETVQIEQNVRNNNNVAWRNLNVIDLTAQSSAEADFEVRPPPGEGSPTSILVRAARSTDGSPLRYVRVAVALDEALFAAWRRGGARARGLRQQEGGLVVEGDVAVLQNIVLAPGSVARMRLRFQRITESPRKDFVVDVVQLPGGDGGRERPLGGVSYVIRTERPPGS